MTFPEYPTSRTTKQKGMTPKGNPTFKVERLQSKEETTRDSVKTLMSHFPETVRGRDKNPVSRLNTDLLQEICHPL